MVVRSCLEQMAGAGGERGGGSERDWGEKRKIRVKNTIETEKEKIKKEKKRQFPSLKLSWKGSCTKSLSQWSITKRQKCSSWIYTIKSWKWRNARSKPVNRPSDSWEKAKKSELEKMAKGRGYGERAKDPPETLSLLLSSTFVFFRSPFCATVHYPLPTTTGTG